MLLIIVMRGLLLKVALFLTVHSPVVCQVSWISFLKVVYVISAEISLLQKSGYYFIARVIKYMPTSG